MKASLTVVMVLALSLCAEISEAHTRNTHMLRGAVVTSDGMMVDQFTIVAHPIVDEPVLIRRHQFTNGIFELALDNRKYELLITAPQFAGVRLELDFPKNSDSTDFKVVILHKFRNDRQFPDPVGTLNVRRLADDISEVAVISYRRGVQFHAEGKLEAALVAYRDALGISPNYIPPLIDSAAIYLMYNRPEAAMAFLRRALERDPQNLAARTNFASALILMKDYGEAIKKAKLILRDSQDASFPHYLLGRAYFLQKKYPLAEEMAAQATTENPGLFDAWQLLLNIALERKDYVATREILLKFSGAMNNEAFSRFVDDQILTLTATNN